MPVFSLVFLILKYLIIEMNSLREMKIKTHPDFRKNYNEIKDFQETVVASHLSNQMHPFYSSMIYFK